MLSILQNKEPLGLLLNLLERKLGKGELIKIGQIQREMSDGSLSIASGVKQIAELRKDARTLPTEDNIRLILHNDDRLGKRIKYNEFTDVLTIDGEPYQDDHLTSIKLWLRDVYNVKNRYHQLVSTSILHEMIIWHSRRNSFDPLKDYLNGLAPWDETPRLEHLLTYYFSAKVQTLADSERTNEELLAEIGLRWAISCVARGLNGGEKVDTVLVLVGRQGAYKSSALQALAGKDFFSDSHLDIRSKDAYQLINQSGTWIWELAELHSLRGASADNAKMFLSASVDRYRPSYGKVPVIKRRRVIFCASTNPSDFLSDPTGARRFWPVEVGKIKLRELAADRDQIWAEAIHYKKNNHQWWLQKKYEVDLEKHQELFTSSDPWERKCQELLENDREGITIDQIMDSLEIPNFQRKRGLSMRIAEILKGLGARKIRSYHQGVRKMVWVREDTEK